MPDEKTADHWFELGKYHSSLGNSRNAILNYLKAVEQDPKLNLAWSNLSAEYFRAKDYPNAIKCAKSALLANRHDSIAWLNLGASYFKKNDDGRAIYCFHQSQELGNAKAKTLLENAAKTKDKMLQAKPIDVSFELLQGEDTAAMPPEVKSSEKLEFVQVKCASCSHRMTFEKSCYQQLPEIVCESCGAEILKKKP